MAIKIKGGVHPQDHKEDTKSKSIESLPLPTKLIIPVRQHIGDGAIPKVKAGDTVKKGQVIADHENGRTPPIHSSTSGKVVDVSPQTHPTLGLVQSIVIEPDGLDEWEPGLLTNRNWESLSPEELITIIFKNGIVGMGGAAFPTHVKLAPPKDKKLDTLIVNGAECEPFLTSDHRIMVEKPELVVMGAQIVKKVLGVSRCVIGIEDNKPDAIEKIRQCCAGTGIEVQELETHYPQGAEKMMIYAITGREVPSGHLPMDTGCVVQNVSTLVAIAQGVSKNIPLIERVVTVSGGPIREPRNLMVPIGTSFDHVINSCGGFDEDPGKVVMGGPMMGIAQVNLTGSVIKSTSGIVAFNKKDAKQPQERDCIRCGRCQAACTMRLQPNMLSILGELGRHATARAEFDLMDCVECGCCTFVCPAKRNIVHYIKLSKAFTAKTARK